MSVFEAVKPQFGQPYSGYASPLAGHHHQGYTMQPFGPQPYFHQPFAPQPYAPQPYAPQPYGPQQFAPFAPQQLFATIPVGPEGIPPIVADVAARCAPHAIAAIIDAVRVEPATLAAIQATGQLPAQVYPMVLMEIANRIAPALHVMMQPNPYAQPYQPYQPYPMQPMYPMAYAGR